MCPSLTYDWLFRHFLSVRLTDLRVLWQVHRKCAADTKLVCRQDDQLNMGALTLVSFFVVRKTRAGSAIHVLLTCALCSLIGAQRRNRLSFRRMASRQRRWNIWCWMIPSLRRSGSATTIRLRLSCKLHCLSCAGYAYTFTSRCTYLSLSLCVCLSSSLSLSLSLFFGSVSLVLSLSLSHFARSGPQGDVSALRSWA